MKIVCKECGTENVIGSLFCRECGISFDFRQRWESYDIQPTSVYSPRVGIRILYEFIKCIVIFVFSQQIYALIVLGIGYVLSGYISNEIRDETASMFFVVLLVILPALTTLIVLKIIMSNWRKHKVYLRRNADYIQSNVSCFQRYRFFLKNNKMGLVDVKRFKVTIPAKYDMLQWRYTDKIVDASLEGERLVLDVRGNMLE